MADKFGDHHGVPLTNSMRPRESLLLRCRVPPRIKKDDILGGGQVYPNVSNLVHFHLKVA
jgi:hypothetical protein